MTRHPLWVEQPWLNTTDYTTAQLWLFFLGCFGWVVAYAAVARMLHRRKFVEIPAAAVAANIAWEFVWGFIFGSGMGKIFTAGYAVWCLQDVFIVANVFRYGEKQIANPYLKRWFRPAFAFGIVAWTVVLYCFVEGGFDTDYGAYSGYILNVMMSALYIPLVLRHDVDDFSVTVGWSKMLGTALLSVFNYQIHGDRPFLMALCGITFVLDCFYLVVLHKRRAETRMPVAGRAIPEAA